MSDIETGRSRYSTLVLDVDSTLSRTEGIEWLARLRGPSIAEHVGEVTTQAMNGQIPLQSVYASRLELIRPTLTEIGQLGDAYIATVMPGAREAVIALRDAGVRVIIVSGGIREAIVPLATYLGVHDSDTFAVSLSFDSAGTYRSFDERSPLARNGGKPEVVRSLALQSRVIALGDGISDAELKTDAPASVDSFAAFVGVASRAPIVGVADFIVHEFDELPAIVLS